MLVCPRCNQTYHDDEPRWDCACGPNRPGVPRPASSVSVAATDDPETWYDNATCFPTDTGGVETMLLRRPIPRPMDRR